MGAVDSLADLEKEVEALEDGEVVLPAVIGNFDAVHQLHDEIRPPRLCSAGFMDLGNMGMVHHRERLALGLEPNHRLPVSIPSLVTLMAT
jgi:hypothetical protein